IKIPNNNSLNPPSAISISGWLNLPATSSGDGEREIVRKDGQYMVRIDPNSESANRLSAFIWGADGSVEPRASITYTPGVPFFLTMTWDGSSLKLYVNGNSQATSSRPVTIPANNNNLDIGALDGGASMVKTGTIVDDIQVWNRALSPTEISTLNSGGQPTGTSVLRLPFENYVLDSSGNENNGAIIGNANYVTPGSGGGTGAAAFQFDGSTYIKIPNNNSLNPPNAISISGWLNLPATSSGDGEREIVRKDGQYMVRIDPNSESANRLSAFIWGADGSVEPRASITYSPGVPFFLTMTWDGTSLKLYVNGNLQTTVTRAVTIPANNNNLAIGALDGGASMVKSGTRVDDIQVWNRALSPTEISTLNSGNELRGIDANGNGFVEYFPLSGDLNKL